MSEQTASGSKGFIAFFPLNNVYSLKRPTPHMYESENWKSEEEESESENFPMFTLARDQPPHIYVSEEEKNESDNFLNVTRY